MAVNYGADMSSSGARFGINFAVRDSPPARESSAGENCPFKAHLNLARPTWSARSFFLLAVWKNASTDVNHGIFVQLFVHLWDIYCIFMLYALCLGSWSQLVATMSNQHSNVRRWSKSCTECEIEMILKRGLRQDESRRRANSTDLN